MGLSVADSLEGSIEASPRGEEQDVFSKENLMRSLSFSIKSIVERTNSIESNRKSNPDSETSLLKHNFENFSDLIKHLYSKSNEIENKMQKSIDKEIK